MRKQSMIGGGSRIVVLSTIGILYVFSGLVVLAEETETEGESASRKAQREENMRAMLKRAQSTTVTLVDRDNRSDALLIPEPLFHYSDEPRRIVDATLWGWTRKGRLVSVCKIEKYDFPPE